VAFRTITSRFDTTCRRCDGSIAAGTRIRWARGRGSWHLAADCGGADGSDHSTSVRRGRCEDAPCCGHSSCGFGPSSPGYGSMVGGMPYFGEN
jgi:hypothetical protein